MAKYNLKKTQVNRLLEGKPVVTGTGRRIVLSAEIMGLLKKIDDNDMYDKVDIVIDTTDNSFDVVKKRV